MKKLRIIAAVTAVALMAMGIGYAAWSQTLPMQVRGSTGNLEATVDCASTNGVANADVEISGDRKAVTLTSSGFYPDNCRQAIYTITFRNTGSIPVKLSSYSVYDIQGPVGALAVGITEQNGRKDRDVALDLSADNTVNSPSQAVIPVNGTMTIKVQVAMPGSVGNEYNFTDPDRRGFSFTICANFVQ